MSFSSTIVLFGEQRVGKLLQWLVKLVPKRCTLPAALRKSRMSNVPIMLSLGHVLIFDSHAHIYGIDLASPNELVAHNRDTETIAKHIGADSVIYQTLEDLKGACAEIAQENGLEHPRNFEVGVFCGNYITPVSEGYFDHLEKIRGEGRKVKAVDRAKEAVTHGFASEKDFQIAANGVKMSSNGDLVPAENPAESEVPQVGVYGSNKPAPLEMEEPPKVKDRMDISIHNIADHS